jgi:uncharacterized OB-fold protein
MGNEKIFHSGALEIEGDSLIQMGFRCNSCGKTSFPVYELCPFCSSGNGTKTPLSKTGKLFSYSITQVPVGPYKPPIIAGYIDLPEGVRVFGQIRAHADDIKTGMRLKMETGTIWVEKDGTEVAGYYYTPCGEEEGGAE